MFRLAPRGVFADCQSLEMIYFNIIMRSLCLMALSSFFLLTFREKVIRPAPSK